MTALSTDELAELHTVMHALLVSTQTMPPSPEAYEPVTRMASRRYGPFFSKPGVARNDGFRVIAKCLLNAASETSRSENDSKALSIAVHLLAVGDYSLEQESRVLAGRTREQFAAEAGVSIPADEPLASAMRRARGVRTTYAVWDTDFAGNRNTLRPSSPRLKEAVDGSVREMRALLESKSDLRAVMRATDARSPRDQRRPTLGLAAAAATSAAVIVAAGLWGVSALSISRESQPDLAVQSPSVESTPAATRSETSPPSAAPKPQTVVSANDGCPALGAGEAAASLVAVDVLYWCTAPVFTDSGDIDPSQLALKLRPSLRNTTSQPMTVAISNPSALRLLVAGDNVGDLWRPPPVTDAAGDRPFLVVCDGQQMWAIPPNLPGETYPLIDNAYLGHATSWTRSTLAPREEIRSFIRYDGERPVKEDNLVFTVPVEDPADLRVRGFAVVNPASRDVLGVSPIDDWAPKALPGSF